MPRPLLRWLLPAALAAALAALHVSPAVARRTPGSLYDEVKSLVERRYFREIDPRELEYDALKGMIGGLDPNSAFFTPDEARAFNEDTEGHFGGLGIEITVEDGIVTVIAPLEDTPAFEAGLLPGDKIIAIDGQPRAFDFAEEAARVLRGPPGTDVRLTVQRGGGKGAAAGRDAEGEDGAAPEVREFTLTRREIAVRSVKHARLLPEDPRIGTVRITQFKPGTAADLRRVVDDLLARGMKALVLDLRSNPGGHLKEAVDVVDHFVEDGLIVRVEGRDTAIPREYRAAREGTLPPFPLAVLVNGYSASAAEVVAGALKDLGRATVVGSRTFGKGSVQSIMPLADQSVVKLTIAHYFTASGRPIHREAGAKASDPWGIVPDVAIDLDARALMMLYRRQASLDFFGSNGGGGGGGGAPPASAGDGLLRDIQLEAAVAVLRERLDRASAPPGARTAEKP